MAEVTTPSRPNRRALQTAETRSQIVDAAARLFLRDGYGATSLSSVAREAGVVVQTVYNSIGGKAALLSAVLDRLAAGPDAPTPVPVFLQERARSASDAGAVVDGIAEWLADVNERLAGLWRVFDEGAAAHDEVAELKRRREQTRLSNYGRAAAELRERDALLPGLVDDDVAALIWSLGHPDVYRALVTDAGWAPHRYRDWIAASLRRGLLRSDTPSASG